MVNLALSIGAGVGILLSAGFVYLEVGRYASPQVPESRFDERKEILSYTAGLFAGIPLAIFLLLLFSAIRSFAIGGIAVYLALLVGGTELAQWLLLRSAYFGSDGSGPFYALGFRAGIGGIIALALVAQYLSGPGVTASGLAAPLSQSLAIVLLEGVGAILSVPDRGGLPRRRSPAARGVPTAIVGFFFVGLAASLGPTAAAVSALALAGAAAWLYRAVAPPMLSEVRPPAAGVLAESAASAFGRTDR